MILPPASASRENSLLYYTVRREKFSNDHFNTLCASVGRLGISGTAAACLLVADYVNSVIMAAISYRPLYFLVSGAFSP